MSIQSSGPESRSTPLSASGKSTTVCQRSGPYRCNTHPEIVVLFGKGQRFTNCPANNESSRNTNAGHATTWSVVREG